VIDKKQLLEDAEFCERQAEQLGDRGTSSVQDRYDRIASVLRRVAESDVGSNVEYWTLDDKAMVNDGVCYIVESP